MHLGPRALTADEIRGPEPVCPFWPVSEPSLLPVTSLPFFHSVTQQARRAHSPSFFHRLRLPRYRSVVDLVKSWSEEKRHYLFPAPKDCTPHCPWRCSGPVCSHYTQVPLCRDEGLVGKIECGGQQVEKKHRPVRTSFYMVSLFLYIH